MSFVPLKCQLSLTEVWTFIPIHRSSNLSLKKVKSFFPQIGQVICPSKISGHLSPQKVKSFALQKGQVICPSKRSSHLSLKKVKSFVSQKGQVICPLQISSHLSLKKLKSWWTLLQNYTLQGTQTSRPHQHDQKQVIQCSLYYKATPSAKMLWPYTAGDLLLEVISIV